jgi:predicted enzyme related to lactoylglutathione lyase
MVTVCRIVLPVDDIEADSVFYQAMFGLAGERVSPGRHYFSCGETVVSCYDWKAQGASAPPRRSSELVYFGVTDIHACHTRALAAGARMDTAFRADIGPLGSVALRPWGEVSFYATDLSGNKLCFVDSESVFRSGKLDF